MHGVVLNKKKQNKDNLIETTLRNSRFLPCTQSTQHKDQERPKESSTYITNSIQTRYKHQISNGRHLEIERPDHHLVNTSESMLFKIHKKQARRLRVDSGVNSSDPTTSFDWLCNTKKSYLN